MLIVGSETSSSACATVLAWLRVGAQAVVKLGECFHQTWRRLHLMWTVIRPANTVDFFKNISDNLRVAEEREFFPFMVWMISNLHSRFAKSGCNCLRPSQSPRYQPPCTAPTPLFSCASLRLHTRTSHKGRCSGRCLFRGAPHGSWIGSARFLRQIESVSVVRALRQTGSKSARKSCLDGMSPSTG